MLTHFLQRLVEGHRAVMAPVHATRRVSSSKASDRAPGLLGVRPVSRGGAGGSTFGRTIRDMRFP